MIISRSVHNVDSSSHTALLSKLMNRPPRRPRLPDGTPESISCYLRTIPPGEEDEQVLESIPSEILLQLSWHEQFRVWLCTQQPNLLPLILAQLQACILQADDSILWGEGESWKQDDVMLQNWKIARHFVTRHVGALALNRQDQLDVERILNGVDQLVFGSQGCTQKSPQEVLQEYRSGEKQTLPGTDHVGSVESCKEFRSWVASHLTENRVQVRQLLLQAIERASQWRIRRALSTVQHDLLREHSVAEDRHRGQALLVSFLDESCGYNLAPVPAISSGTNLRNVVESYLYNDTATPDVKGLVLALWDHHIMLEDILETVTAFASWLPIAPIATRYRSMLVECFTSGGTFMTRQVLRATDMLSCLIGSEAEEWTQVFDTEMCHTVLLPLVHELILDETAMGKCALLGVVLERILQRSDCLLEACPQLAWIVFLFSDITVLKDDDSNVVDQMMHLYKRVSAIMTPQMCKGCCLVDSAILPPLSVYMDSALVACTRRDSQAASAWVHHVVVTLARYQQCDTVAIEWIRALVGMTNVETSLTLLLHQQVCLFLWGRKAQQTPSNPVSQLLTEADNACASRILLVTPPECLFAHQSEMDVVSSLETLLATFGKGLSVILVGLALRIPDMKYSATACRDLLYQHLRNELMGKRDLEGLFKWVERELLTYPQSLEWWKTLHAELVRNEVVMNTADSESSVTDTSLELVDELLSKGRKRAREDDTIVSHNVARVKARSGASAGAVLQKLWGGAERTTTEAPPSRSPVVDEVLNDAEFPDPENEDSVSNDDEDEYHDEEDDRILLL